MTQTYQPDKLGSDVNNETSKSAILLIHCPDQKGIVISITEFIFKNGGNILYLDQHVDTERQIFFMRIEWDLHDFVIADSKIGEYFETLVAKRFSMNWRLHFSDEVPRMALFVSSLPHCFYDILARYEANRLRVVRQGRYSLHNENSIDLVLFLNGLPVFTAELKNQQSGQSVLNGIKQYRNDRH